MSWCQLVLNRKQLSKSLFCAIAWSFRFTHHRWRNYEGTGGKILYTLVTPPLRIPSSTPWESWCTPHVPSSEPTPALFGSRLPQQTCALLYSPVLCPIWSDHHWLQTTVYASLNVIPTLYSWWMRRHSKIEGFRGAWGYGMYGERKK